MKIKQFEDKGLAHFSYAVVNDDLKEMIIIDPARNPQPYYDFAQENNTRIKGIIETHPHADFVSSHLEIHKTTGATIYTSSLVGAEYPYQAFDEGNIIDMEDIKLKAIHTPGHSPDGISIVLTYRGKDTAVFTGDTLFIGDVGRPDLRENAGNITAKREELARLMFYSTREKLMKLANDVVVYPAHGSGSLCGKALSEANSSTIGAEKIGNYALQPMSEDEFVILLLKDQPFVPKYFPYDVELNKKGAPAFEETINKINLIENNFIPEQNDLIVDGRPQKLFKKSHFKGAINIQNGLKFETWLGSIVEPKEKFYLVADTENQLNELIEKTSKIGYELNIKGAIVYEVQDGMSSKNFDNDMFYPNQDNYTIVDVRNSSEVKSNPIFNDSINIPLPELRERVVEIPKSKPIVVHCAGGYRSAAGSSILENLLLVSVYDMGENINKI